jgi:phosphoribosylpyrophosphate synthetase
MIDAFAPPQENYIRHSLFWLRQTGSRQAQGSDFIKISDLLVASGTDRVLTMDLHAPQIQGFFNIPVDHLFGAPVPWSISKVKPAQPDGCVARRGRRRTRAFAKRLNTELQWSTNGVSANVAQVNDRRRQGRTCLVSTTSSTRRGLW